jgi:prepilin-type N-terminal cleavage/methylation domain-containing protein
MIGARARRGGFTLVEMVVVVAVVSILARIALPNLQESVIRARAAAAMGDVDVVRTAAANYHARTNLWPVETPPGVVPPELTQDLPEGFIFERGEYQLDWEHWSLPDGLPPHTAAKTLIGVSIITSDDLLGNAVAALIGNNGWYSLGRSYTFLVEGL